MDVISSIKHEPIKEEPDDVPLNFLYPDDQPEQSPNIDKNKASCNDFILRPSVLAQPTDLTNHGDLLSVEEDGSDKGLIASTPAQRFPNDMPIVRNLETSSGDRINGSNLFSGHPQLNLPDFRSHHSMASNNLGSGENGQNRQLNMSSLFDKSVGSKHEETQQSETVLKCVAIPVEELSHFEQISIKTDEVFINDAGNNETLEDVLSLGNARPQTEDHSVIDLSSGSQRTKRKSHVYKRTMQTRTSSGSLPKSPRIPGMIEIDQEQRLGLKKYSCSSCNESFATKVSLSRHVSDVHDGLSKNPGKSTDSVTFMCPICDITCKRKFGLKRHLTSKHSRAKSICCLECNYKAKNYQVYLKHLDKHDSSKPTSIQLPEKTDQPDNEMFKCHECPEVFKNKDTLNLHILNHKLAMSLSHTEHSKVAEKNSNCTCLLNSNKILDSSHCALHLPTPISKSNSNNKGCHEISLSCLPHELKSETEKSLDIIFKLTSKLESLTQSLKGNCSSPSSQNLVLLPTINQVSSLSSELTNLSTTLGHTLLSKKEVKAETIQEEGDVDFTEVHEESDDCKINEKNEEDKEGIPRKNNRVESSKFKIKRRKRGRPALKSKKQSYACESDFEFDHGFTCLECGKKMKDHIGLKRHMVIHGKTRPFECDICQRTFYRREHLSKHLVKHTQERPFKCEICNYSAKSNHRLQRHCRIHVNRQNPELHCGKCSFKAVTSHLLSKHEDKHKPCQLCGYEAVDVNDYKSHKSSHCAFNCTECNFVCHSRWQLKRHSKKKHSRLNPEDGKFFCELCGYSCLDRRQFSYHMVRHENKTPFACEVCDYKCSSRTSFDSHKLMHAGLRPYLCSFCGASFRRTSHLNNHMLIHKDVKKHACRTCGRLFRSRYNLKMHEMLHTGEKQFKCHLCDFACRRNKELRLHISKHDPFDDEKDIKPLPLETQNEDSTVPSVTVLVQEL